jgi:hypothetical protein
MFRGVAGASAPESRLLYGRAPTCPAKFLSKTVCIVPHCSSLVSDCSSLAPNCSSVFRSRLRVLVDVSLQRRLKNVGRSALRAAHSMGDLGHVGGSARTW